MCRYGGGVSVLLLLLLLLLLVSVTSCEKCFRCGHDRSWPCTDRMPLISFADINDDVICIHLGSCLKFTGTAILLPGYSHFL